MRIQRTAVTILPPSVRVYPARHNTRNVEYAVHGNASCKPQINRIPMRPKEDCFEKIDSRGC